MRDRHRGYGTDTGAFFFFQIQPPIYSLPVMSELGSISGGVFPHRVKSTTGSFSSARAVFM